MANKGQWPAPPEIPGNFQQGIGTTKHLSVGLQQSHFCKQLLFRQTELRPHPGSLQRQQDELSAGQQLLTAFGPGYAERAVPIVKHPSRHFFAICRFSMHRNIR